MKISRRTLLKSATALPLTPVLKCQDQILSDDQRQVVRIGVIADLHQDIIHDAQQRLEVFVDAARAAQVDAVLQLGDFAVPSDQNQPIIDLFNSSHERALHVIGNHDMDFGHTRQQCVDRWEMPATYYTKPIGGLQVIVLDGNDPGSPTHRGGYPCYIGPKQQEWLRAELADLAAPAIVVSHQPLAGAGAIDNGAELQAILGEHADKILLALNGHTHIDAVRRVQGVSYMHVNSAAYKWVGNRFRHLSYPAEIHVTHPSMASTCPYRDSLFALMTIDVEQGIVDIRGRQSEWVGPSPGELGADAHPTLTNGEEIAPRIRNRRLIKV